ncbi:MAG: AAA family ATPase [Phycisphaeraceae bacterium]|nr:MAG: AAA family ATPase [Phycisphaeraceae bacterium]
MRTIAIINQKGGCGKTTTAINLAAVLAAEGRRTLLVDLDPQSHCAAGLAVPAQQIEFDIGDAMLSLPGKGFEPARLLWRVTRNLDLAPSRTKLAGLEATRGGLASAAERERRLGKVLEHVRSRVADQPFEFAVIDCPPSIGLLTYNAITAAGEIIIPVETSFFSLQGATKQVATIRSLGRRLGTRPATRLMATMHDADHGLACDLHAELCRRFESAMVPVTIRFDQAVRESASFGQPVIDYAPASPGAADYRALGAWLLGLEGSAEPDATVIEVKRTAVPLGARRPPAEAERAEHERGVVRRGQALARPLHQEGEAPERAEAAGREPGRTAAVRSAQAKAASVAERVEVQTLETMSRVEDLCRRAQALQQRISPSTSDGETRLRSANGSLALIEQPYNRTKREKSVARLFGARPASGRLLFVQPIELGLDVRVAGDFNGWSPTATPMRRNESLGVHEATVDAPPGRHCYKLVVDGRWLEDQFNPETAPNEFGERNSVVTMR